MLQTEKGFRTYTIAQDLIQQVNQNGGTISLEQALNLMQVAELHRIGSFCREISSETKNIHDLCSADSSLTAVVKRLSEINTTLFDTLGSYKTGAALDAITEIAKVMQTDEPKEED